MKGQTGRGTGRRQVRGQYRGRAVKSQAGRGTGRRQEGGQFRGQGSEGAGWQGDREEAGKGTVQVTGQ